MSACAARRGVETESAFAVGALETLQNVGDEFYHHKVIDAGLRSKELREGI